MVVRLLAFLIFYLGLLLVPGAGISYLVYRAAKPLLEFRKKRALAAKHAKELAAHERTQCNLCLEDGADCYEKKKGFYHEKCMKALTG